MSASSSEGWSRGQRWLHWTVAALVFAGFGVGLLMVALPLTQLLAKIVAYQIHKSIGLLVPPLVVWRLWLRARRGRPREDHAIPAWQRRAATAAHGALYVLLLVVPLLGYLSASTAPVQIETTLFLLIPVPHLLAADEALFKTLRDIHQALAWTLVLLAVGHGAMALRHHLLGRSTLRRMWRGFA